MNSGGMVDQLWLRPGCLPGAPKRRMRGAWARAAWMSTRSEFLAQKPCIYRTGTKYRSSPTYLLGARFICWVSRYLFNPNRSSKCSTSTVVHRRILIRSMY